MRHLFVLINGDTVFIDNTIRELGLPSDTMSEVNDGSAEFSQDCING